MKVAGRRVCVCHNRTFRDKYTCARHERDYRQVVHRPHTCKRCVAKFRFKSQLRKHVKDVHSTSRVFCCNTCRLETNRRFNLTRHLQSFPSHATSHVSGGEVSPLVQLQRDYATTSPDEVVVTDTPNTCEVSPQSPASPTSGTSVSANAALQTVLDAAQQELRNSTHEPSVSVEAAER